MNAGSLTSWVKRLIQLAKSKGIWEAAQGITWVIKTSLTKRYIRLQDRWGLFTYEEWFQLNEAETQPPLPAQTNWLFGFLIPYTAGASSLLRETLDSLEAQSYPYWEICLIYESRHASEVANIQRFNARPDARINQLQHDPIQASLKAGTESLNGQWVGVLGCGDTLSPHALTSIVDIIHENPDTDIIYSDEDQLSPDGETRLRPFFKPDWSPELLLSINYLSHAIFSQDAFKQAAGSGSDYADIVYRCADQACHPLHIPKVLLHIRQGVMNPWISKESHQLRRLRHIHPEAVQDLSGQPNWTDPSVEGTLISIIIPTKDQVLYLQQCIDSLLNKTRYRNFEIILVENNSHEPQTFEYYDRLRQVPGVRIVEYSGKFNYSKANNLGARHARGEVLLFLNNDVEIIDPDWLEELYVCSCVPAVGAVGGKLLHPNNRIQHAGIVVGMEGHASHVFAGVIDGYTSVFGSTDWYRNYLAVTGACMAMRRDVFDTVGGFDENYRLIFSDVEICLRIGEAGYRIVYTPYARLIHHEGRTRFRRIPPQDIERAADHLRQIVSIGDPFYNPNLSYTVRVPTFKRGFEETPLNRLDNILRFF